MASRWCRPWTVLTQCFSRTISWRFSHGRSETWGSCCRQMGAGCPAKLPIVILQIATPILVSRNSIVERNVIQLESLCLFKEFTVGGRVPCERCEMLGHLF